MKSLFTLKESANQQVFIPATRKTIRFVGNQYETECPDEIAVLKGKMYCTETVIVAEVPEPCTDVVCEVPEELPTPEDKPVETKRRR